MLRGHSDPIVAGPDVSLAGVEDRLDRILDELREVTPSAAAEREIVPESNRRSSVDTELGERLASLDASLAQLSLCGAFRIRVPAGPVCIRGSMPLVTNDQ